MGVFNKTFVSCDTCGTEACIDETGECGLPVSEMMPLGWQSDDGQIKCLGCIERKSIDEVLDALRELHDFSVEIDGVHRNANRSIMAFIHALQVLEKHGK